MNKRAIWYILFAVIGLAGLAAGIFLVQSLNFLRGDAAEPTLASVAEQVETATETRRAPTATAPAPPTPTDPIVVAPQTAQPTETPVLAATPAAEPAEAGPISHIVQPGETLTSISDGYNVSIDAIIAVNDIPDPDNILDGSELLIPNEPAEVMATGGDPATAAPTEAAATRQTTATATPMANGTRQAAPTTTPAASNAGPADWPPSLTSGNLSGNYPLQLVTTSGALLIHYQPGTYPAENVETLAPAVDAIFAELQSNMGGAVPRQVDLYLGGTLFGVNPSLQGFTQSYEFRSFVLVNGAFHPGERDYIIGHELAHVAATHILGPASSTMIHEGLATYLPQKYLTGDAGYLPLKEICAAAYNTPASRSARELSQLSYGETAFGGHIRTFFNYNLSGCFVGYLLENYTMEQLDQVYDTGNYSGVYGLSLAQLDDAWQASLAETPFSVDAGNFVALVEEIADAYESYVVASAGGHHAHYEAYLHLNRARLEVNRGKLDAARDELETFRSLFGS